MQPFVTGKMPKGYFDFAKDPNYAGNQKPRPGAVAQMNAMKKASAAKEAPKKTVKKPATKKPAVKPSPAKQDMKFQAARKQYYNIKK